MASINISLNNMAMSLLRVQNNCTESALHDIETVMKNLKNQSTIPAISAFELVELYLHTNDKQSFCVIFAMLTGMTWSSFMNKLLSATNQCRDAMTVVPPSQRVPQNEWTAQDNQNLMMLLDASSNNPGEFSRRLNYITRLKNIKRIELAEQVGLGRTTLYRYMLSPQDAEFGLPHAKNARRILQALPISPSVFCAHPDDFTAWQAQLERQRMV